MAGPIITLTTDFGLRDPFVGIMKGVILGLAPSACLVDLTHEVAAQDVLEAQLALESAVPFFPSGTIHLVVVDPGVGGPRRGLAVQARGQYFLGPDNGLFTFAFASPGWSAVALTSTGHRLAEVSATFHGRDVFAPAAAHLLRGVPLTDFGPDVRDPVRRPVPAARLEGDQLVGEVVAADRFGNLLTSVTRADVAMTGRDIVDVELGRARFGAPVRYYAQAEGRPGTSGPAAIWGSAGRLEIFVPGRSAKAWLTVDRGAPVRVKLG
jgi:S-adenosylmethionine hydrolase